MIKLFSEKVNATLTNSDHNILQVESYEEAFFDVYEFELNGQQYIRESIGKVGDDPVISVPIVENGKEYELPFVLKQGPQKVSFKKENQTLVEKVIEQPKIKEVEQAIKENTEIGKAVNINYSVPKEELFADFKKEREASLKDLRAQNAKTLAEVERLRDSLLAENRSDVFELRTIEQEKLDNYIADKLSDISKTNEILAEKIERDVDLTLEASYSDIVGKIIDARNELKQRRIENVKLVGELTTLERAHIELQDTVSSNQSSIEKSEKAVNKALSRLGQTNKSLEESKKEFESIKHALFESIENAGKKVEEVYAEKANEVGRSAFANVRRSEIIAAVKDSKAQILTELKNTKNLKKQVDQLIQEGIDDAQYDPEKGNKEFQKEIRKNISKQFSNEMMNIKRMIEYSAGGGTNAVQYKDGGTMNGALDVTGGILSGGINLSDIFGTPGGGAVGQIVAGNNITISPEGGTGVVTINATGGGGGGSDVSGLSGSWQSTYTTMTALSSGWQDTYTRVNTNAADWQSTYTTMTASSGNWDSAYTWCNTNGNNVYDTITTSPTQGQFTITDVGGTSDTVDLGLQPADSPTFAGLTLNGEIDMTADKIVNVADPTSAQDAATKAYVDANGSGTVCSVTAGNGTITVGGTATDPTVRIADACVTSLSTAFSAAASSTQGNISLTRLNGGSANLDIGLTTGDSPTFLSLSSLTLKSDAITSTSLSSTGNITTTGNIVSAGVNIDQLFGSGGGGTYDSSLASNIAMTEDVGGLATGTTVASLTGSTFSALFDTMLFPTVDPVVGSNNSTSLTDNVTNLQTIGATINITLGTSASLGTLRLNGATQGAYAGAVTAASISGPGGPYTLGVGPGDTDIDDQAVSNHAVTEGSNSWTLTTTFAQGPMPLDSAGNDFPSIRFAGGTRTNSTSFEGVYPIRLGLSTGSGNFENRALTSHSSNNIECSQDYSETVSIRHRIAIPDDMIDSQTVGWQQYNALTESYSDIAASNFTVSSISVTIEGNSVGYKLYTKTGAPGGGDVSGNPLYRIKFS